jgi:hypothetical protein
LLAVRSARSTNGRAAALVFKLNFNQAFPRLFSQSLERAGKQDACAPVENAKFDLNYLTAKVRHLSAEFWMCRQGNHLD